jgi:phosphonatase-like hydrolase
MNQPDTLFDLAILDMAGTTIAATDHVPAAFREALAEADIAVSDDAIGRVRGRSKREAIRELAVTDGDGPDTDRASSVGNGEATPFADRIHERFREILRARYEQGVRPIDGALETIDWLRAHGTKVVLATGFDRELALMLLRTLGWIDDHVDGLVTADDVRHGRPDPEIIHRAMALAAVTDPGRVLVAGDTMADLECGERAKAGCVIGVLSGAHTYEQLRSARCTAILDSIADLPAWMRERSKSWR